MSLARALPTASAFLVLFVLARFLLTPEELAHYRKLWPFFSLWAPVVISAIVNAAYFRGSDTEKTKAALGQTAVMFFFGGLLVGVSAFLLSGHLAQFFNVPFLVEAYVWFGFYAMAAIWGSSAEPIFVLSGKRSHLPAFAAFFTTIDALAILIPFWLGFLLVDVVKWMIAGQLARQFIIIPCFIKWRAPLPKQAGAKLIDRHVFTYAGGMALLTLSGVGASEIDRFIIGRFLDDAAFILYDVGARKLPFITILTASVTSAVVAGYASKVSNGDFGPALVKIKRSTTVLIRMLLPSILYLSFAAIPFVSLIFGNDYAGSGPVFALFLVALVSNLFFPQSLVLATGRVRVNVAGAIAELAINVILSLVLVQNIGIIGVALATVVAHWFYTALMALYCKFRLEVNIRHFLPDPLGWQFYLTFVVAILFGQLSTYTASTYVLLMYVPVGLLTIYFSKKWL